MDWLTLAGIIAQEGLSVAEAVYNKWSVGQMPTAQDFIDLRALGKVTPESLVLKAASLANIDASDPKVLALLSLVSAPAAPVPPKAP